MKVKELEKGMMLACADPQDCFSLYGADEKWVMVRRKPVTNKFGRSVNVCADTVIIYLGTKKDINIKMKWTDRFVLVDNQIVGVDPASWRLIKPIKST